MMPGIRWIALTPGPKHRLDGPIEAQFYALQELVAIRQRERNGDDSGPATHEVAAPPISAREATLPKGVRGNNWTPEARAAATGKKRTPEQRARMAAAQALRWKRKRAAAAGRA